MNNSIKRFGIKTITGMAALMMSLSSIAGPVDLSTWGAEGGASNWSVSGGNSSVVQSVNGDPTVFYDNSVTSTQNKALKGGIKVNTSSDDDFIGFVLGYSAGEISDTNTDFLLIDWKQGNQNIGGVDGYGQAGLAISRVTDSTNWWNDFWGHGGGVSEIARANTLGTTGWADYVEYDFSITFTSSIVEVLVNGVLELQITAADAGVGAFDDGAFGFYNMSQSQVQYNAIEQTDCQITPNLPECQSVPAPPAAFLLLLGLLGIATGSSRLISRS